MLLNYALVKKTVKRCKGWVVFETQGKDLR